MERRLLGRSRNWSVKFDRAETAWETRKQSCRRGREQYSRGRKVGAAILISDKIDFKMKLIEGVGPHRILPMPQQAYRPAS